MSLTAYEFDSTWVLDATKINAPVGSEYIAWRLAVNDVTGLALWVFAEVDSGAAPITDYLPLVYDSFTLTDDLAKYGYVRNVLPKASIGQLETEFNNLAGIISDSIDDGFA